MRNLLAFLLLLTQPLCATDYELDLKLVQFTGKFPGIDFVDVLLKTPGAVIASIDNASISSGVPLEYDKTTPCEYISSYSEDGTPTKTTVKPVGTRATISIVGEPKGRVAISLNYTHTKLEAPIFYVLKNGQPIAQPTFSTRSLENSTMEFPLDQWYFAAGLADHERNVQTGYLIKIRKR